jgi:hypothetical protein
MLYSAQTHELFARKDIGFLLTIILTKLRTTYHVFLIPGGECREGLRPFQMHVRSMFQSCSTEGHMRAFAENLHKSPALRVNFRGVDDNNVAVTGRGAP